MEGVGLRYVSTYMSVTPVGQECWLALAEMFPLTFSCTHYQAAARSVIFTGSSSLM